MDRSIEFKSIISSYATESNSSPGAVRPRVSASPFLIQCGNMMRRIHQMEKKISLIFDKYVNFHCQFQQNDNCMNDADRRAIDQEITIFAITWTTEINEMKKNCITDHRQQLNEQSREHFHVVISFLLDRLQSFTRLSQSMRRLHARFVVSPFKLQQHPQARGVHSPSGLDTSQQLRGQTAHLRNKSKGTGAMERDTAALSSTCAVKVTDRSSPSVRGGETQGDRDSSFAERYSAEIAPPSKMKEYNDFALKHKEALLAESRQLSDKYDEDMLSASKAERTVAGLFEMLNEFIAVVRAQESLVEDVHDASKAATSHVLGTDEQLVLTLQRSKSYQASTVGLIVGLAFFLLLLDALTP